MPDPNLKLAAAEISEVLKKYNAAGIILLCSQTHMEYLYEITPTWACLEIEKGDDGVVKSIRFKSKLENYKSVDDQKKVAEDSLGMVYGLGELANRASEQMAMLSGAITSHYQEVRHVLRDE